MPSACIVGAGAIGGWLASLLHDSGWDVRLLARGRTLEALREHGLHVETAMGERCFDIPASDDPDQLGAAEYVILTVKGQDLPELAPRLEPLLAGGGALVTAMNGLQWWFTDGLAGPLDGAVLRDLGLPDDDERVNPNGGAIALGHPLGMSGARLALTATEQLQQTGGKYALCTMCIGVGQGIALAIERV